MRNRWRSRSTFRYDWTSEQLILCTMCMNLPLPHPQCPKESLILGATLGFLLVSLPFIFLSVGMSKWCILETKSTVVLLLVSPAKEKMANSPQKTRAAPQIPCRVKPRHGLPKRSLKLSPALQNFSLRDTMIACSMWPSHPVPRELAFDGSMAIGSIADFDGSCLAAPNINRLAG